MSAAPPAAASAVRSHVLPVTEAPPPMSVGMPAYNAERYIGAAIESVLAQTDGDFELVVSDNASTDGTEEICRAAAARDPRVRYTRCPENVGASRNFARVFRLARAPLFRWCAADDLWEPALLARCRAAMRERPDVVLCYPRTVLIDAAGEPIRVYDGDLDLQEESPARRFAVLSSRLGLCHAMFGLMRSDVVAETALIANYSGADQVFLAQMAILGKFLLVPEPLFKRRFHSDSSSANTSIAAQQAFYDPRTRGKVFLRQWRHTLEKWRFLGRVDLPLGERIAILRELLRQARWNRSRLWSEAIVALGAGRWRRGDGAGP